MTNLNNWLKINMALKRLLHSKGLVSALSACQQKVEFMWDDNVLGIMISLPNTRFTEMCECVSKTKALACYMI